MSINCFTSISLIMSGSGGMINCIIFSYCIKLAMLLNSCVKLTALQDTQTMQHNLWCRIWNSKDKNMTNKYIGLYSEVKHDFYDKTSNGAMGQWWYKEVALQAQCVFYSQCVRDSIKNVTWHFDDSQVLGVDPNARENCCLHCRGKSLSLSLSDSSVSMNSIPHS